MTDKERGLGQRAIGVTNRVIGQKERTFRVARLIFWVHIQRAVGFPKKKEESCWFACVYDNPFQLTFLIVPNYLLWKIKKKRRSGWGDMVKVVFHISDCVVIF